MRYGVDASAVTADAGGVSRALELLALVGVGDALGPLALGLPGTRTVRCLPQARSDWDRQVGAARRELGSVGETMAAAASTYDQVEAIAARVLGGQA